MNPDRSDLVGIIVFTDGKADHLDRTLAVISSLFLNVERNLTELEGFPDCSVMRRDSLSLAFSLEKHTDLIPSVENHRGLAKRWNLESLLNY